jgi:hypothetical protein
MVRGRQSIDSKLCKVDLNTRWDAPVRTTTKRFQKLFWSGSILTVFGAGYPAYPARHPDSRSPPVASRETHPKMSNSKIPRCLIKVLGLPVPFPTSAYLFKHLTHNSHWAGAQISCSYHVSNPLRRSYDSYLGTYSRE